MIQYSEAPMLESRGRSVLDTPHARGMTTFYGATAVLLQSRTRACDMLAA
jgi:hypothetical protein